MGATEYSPVAQQEETPVTPTANEQTEQPQQQAADLSKTTAEIQTHLRRSSLWVYYMIVVQVAVSFYYPSNLAFCINLAANLLGFVGVYKKNRCLITVHFGYTIGVHCLVWFFVFYTVFYNATYALLAIAFCLTQMLGLRHERNLLHLMSVMTLVHLQQVIAVSEQQEARVQQQQPQQQQQQPEPHVQHAANPMPSFVYVPYGQQYPVPAAEQQQQQQPFPYPAYYPMPQQAFPSPYAAYAQQQQGPLPPQMFPQLFPQAQFMYYPPTTAEAEAPVANDKQ